MLKRLLEGRKFAYPVEGLPDKYIVFCGPIIFISNFFVIDDAALLSRLFVVSAAEAFYEEACIALPKEEAMDVPPSPVLLSSSSSFEEDGEEGNEKENCPNSANT